MMGERTVMQEALFYSFSLEDHVPADHLLRSINRFVELDGSHSFDRNGTLSAKVEPRSGVRRKPSSARRGGSIRMRVSIYNSQLCVLAPELRRFARRSISDWKQEYMPECDGCQLVDECGGFFSSAKYRYSRAIRPVLEPAA